MPCHFPLTRLGKSPVFAGTGFVIVSCSEYENEGGFVTIYQDTAFQAVRITGCNAFMTMEVSVITTELIS